MLVGIPSVGPLLFPVCSHRVITSILLSLSEVDSPLLLNTPSFSPLGASHSTLPSASLFSAFSHILPRSLSQRPTVTDYCCTFLHFFVWNFCVNAGRRRGCRATMCRCAAQHINLLGSSSRRQACACCSMCLCNL